MTKLSNSASDPGGLGVTTYPPRIIDDELHELLTGSRAIVVEGARAVGKTATALRVASSVARLDDPNMRQISTALSYQHLMRICLMHEDDADN